MENKVEKFRLNSLDILRGLALLLMIVSHFSYWLVDTSKDFDLMPFFNIIAYIACPLFLIILGIGQAFSMHFKKIDGVTEREIGIHILKRSGWFLLLSFAFNIGLELNNIQINPIAILSWQIFSIILFSTVFLYIIRNLPIKFKIILIGIVFFLNVALHYLLNVSTMTNQYILNFTNGFDVISALLFNGHFSPFPFLIFGILGSIIGDWYLKIKKEGTDINQMVNYLLIFGIIFIIVGVLIEPYIFVDTAGVHFYFMIRATHSSTLFNIGLGLVLVSIFIFIVEIKNKGQKIFEPLKRFGKSSLTLVIAHTVLIIGTGSFLEIIWGMPIFRALGWLEYSIILMGFLIGWSILLVFWRKKDYKYSIDWLVKKYS